MKSNDVKVYIVRFVTTAANPQKFEKYRPITATYAIVVRSGQSIKKALEHYRRQTESIVQEFNTIGVATQAKVVKTIKVKQVLDGAVQKEEQV